MSKFTVWLRKTSSPVLIVPILLMVYGQIHAQNVENLRIDKVYQLARDNYPLIKQRGLIAKTRDFTVSNAAKGYIPTFQVNGQATYQSDVTNFPFKIPIAGFTLPSYSKDQYRAYAEIDQVIYDGGLIKNQKQTAIANEGIQQQNLEVELYSLYDRVNQLFFGALLMDEQLKQNTLLKQDIQNGIDKTKALLANGMVYRSSVDELMAQLLQTEQARVEYAATRKAYLDMLSLFVNQTLDENTKLEKPAIPELTDSISRPELLFYDFQKKTYDLQEDLLKVQLRPKFSFYAQGGYARPGLNMLSNNFEWYYIGGIRLNWNLGSWYTLKNQRNILLNNKEILDIQKETFLFNSKLTQKQQKSDLSKYAELLRQDQGIIQLRESVKNAASAQLENGVLSAHDYIHEVNEENLARQNLIVHQVQLLQAQYNYQNTTGNITLK